MTEKCKVFAPGAWDLFHVGHLALINRARNMASILIIGIDTDESIKEKKGAPPIIPFLDRVSIVRGCTAVDMIYKTKSGSVDVLQLQQLGIDVVVLGSDWKNKDLAGKKKAKAAGINFVYFPYTEHTSSTQIQAKILERFKNPDRQELKTQWSKD